MVADHLADVAYQHKNHCVTTTRVEKLHRDIQRALGADQICL